MSTQTRLRISEWGILLLLAFTILWKGGKSLESTWLVAGTGALLILLYWFEKIGRMTVPERPLEAKQDLSHQRNELPLMYWVIALSYLGWSIASYAFSETKNYGVDEIFRSAGYMFIFLSIARRQIEGEQTLLEKKFPLVITFSTIVAICIGIGVYVFQPVNRFVGTFFDYRFHTDYWPNAWAEYLLLAWPLIVLCAWRHSSSFCQKVLPLILGVVLSALMLSYSRGAMIAFVMQLLLLGALFGTTMMRDIRYRRTWAATTISILKRAAVAVVIAIILFFSINALRQTRFDVQSVTQKVTFTAAEGRSSVDERAQFWDQAIAFIKERPVFGWGPYSFRFIQPKKMENVLATSDHPHNVFLKIAMERGIPGMILYMSIFGVVLGVALFSFFHARKATSVDNDMQIAMMIVAVSGVVLHNMIDFNLQFVSISFGTIMCLGFLVAPAKSVIGDAALTFRRWRIRKNLSKLDCIFATFILLALLWEGAFLVTSSLGRHAMSAGNAEEALKWFNRSHGELMTRDLYLSEAQLYMDQKNYAAAENALNRYASMNDEDPRVWKMRGDLYLRTGEADKALSNLETAYAKGKFVDAGIMHLLLEAIRRTRKEVEYSSRKYEFDSIFSDYADAIEQNTHFIALSQNVEELQDIAQLLSLLYPGDGQRYKAIARKAMQHANEEREKYDARAQGLLW